MLIRNYGHTNLHYGHIVTYMRILGLVPPSSSEVGVHGRPKGLRYSATPFSRRMFHTFSGVIGMSMWRTPRCASASTTALAIAGGAPTVADSPTPLARFGRSWRSWPLRTALDRDG
jgi:hypothetical protein